VEGSLQKTSSMLNRLHADAIDEHCQRSGPLCSTCSHRRCTRLEAQRKSDGRPVHVGTRSVATSPANRSPVREQLRVNDACTSQWSSAGVLEPRLGHCNAVRIVVRLLRVLVCVRACSEPRAATHGFGPRHSVSTLVFRSVACAVSLHRELACRFSA